MSVQPYYVKYDAYNGYGGDDLESGGEFEEEMILGMNSEDDRDVPDRHSPNILIQRDFRGVDDPSVIPP